MADHQLKKMFVSLVDMSIPNTLAEFYQRLRREELFAKKSTSTSTMVRCSICGTANTHLHGIRTPATADGSKARSAVFRRFAALFKLNRPHPRPNEPDSEEGEDEDVPCCASCEQCLRSLAEAHGQLERAIQQFTLVRDAVMVLIVQAYLQDKLRHPPKQLCLLPSHLQDWASFLHDFASPALLSGRYDWAYDSAKWLKKGKGLYQIWPLLGPQLQPVGSESLDWKCKLGKQGLISPAANDDDDDADDFNTEQDECRISHSEDFEDQTTELRVVDEDFQQYKYELPDIDDGFGQACDVSHNYHEANMEIKLEEIEMMEIQDEDVRDEFLGSQSPSKSQHEVLNCGPHAAAAAGIPRSSRSRKRKRKSTKSQKTPEKVKKCWKMKSPKPDRSLKPKATYVELIEKALYENGEGLTVSQLYSWIATNHAYFGLGEDRWKNSVRHNLSTNPNFEKRGRGKCKIRGPGPHLWRLSETCRKRIEEEIQQNAAVVAGSSQDESIDISPPGPAAAKAKAHSSSLECSFCQRSLATSSQKSAHEKHHRKGDKKYYNCSFCSRILRYRGHFVKHLEQEHKDVAVLASGAPLLFFQCDAKGCDNCFGSKTLLELHIDTVHESNPGYKCGLCDKAFAEQDHLTAHQDNFHGTGAGAKLPCQYCHLAFVSKEQLSFHAFVHQVSLSHDTDVYCEICGNVFPTLPKLAAHTSKMHARFAQAVEATTEITINDEVVKRQRRGKFTFFPCRVCGKTFAGKAGLKSHSYEHLPGHPGFPCSECDRILKTPVLLSRHKVNVHRQIKCRFCGKGIWSISVVREHEFKHHHEEYMAHKPWYCPVCYKNFGEQDELNSHVQVHATSQCKICGLQCTHPRGLKVHERAHYIGRVESVLDDKSADGLSAGASTSTSTSDGAAATASAISNTCSICSEELPSKELLHHHYIETHKMALAEVEEGIGSEFVRLRTTQTASYMKLKGNHLMHAKARARRLKPGGKIRRRRRTKEQILADKEKDAQLSH